MRRLIPLALLAYAVASLLVYLFGDSGVVALDRLADYRTRLERNVTELERLNLSLQAELASLRADPQRTLVLARDLGLYRSDDRVLRIEGGSSVPEPYEVGTLLRLKAPRVDRGPWLKTGVLVAAAAAALLVFLLGRRSRRHVHGARRR
jgi:hypothetical protein